MIFKTTKYPFPKRSIDLIAFECNTRKAAGVVGRSSSGSETGIFLARKPGHEEREAGGDRGERGERGERFAAGFMDLGWSGHSLQLCK